MKFVLDSELRKRFILYLIGMNIMAVGIVLSTRSHLGVAAISSVAYSYSIFCNISFGIANIILFTIFILIQALLMRSFSYALLLQIPIAFLVGLFIDLYDIVIPDVAFCFEISLMVIIISNILTGIGVYAMNKSNLVLDPGNAVVSTLCKVLDKPFSVLRIQFDISLVLFTLISGLLISNEVIGIGIGTIISAYLIGKSVGVTGKLFDRYIHFD